MNKYIKVILGTFTCFALIASLAGCIGLYKSWGKITPDTQVKKDFDIYQVNSDFNYYISGSDVYPNAILGLNKAYILDSTLWKKVDLTPAKLQELVTDMKSRAMNIGQRQFGFAVLDNMGKQIGVWYSLLSASTSIQMKSDNKVMIYTPDYDTYEKYETRSLPGMQ